MSTSSLEQWLNNGGMLSVSPEGTSGITVKFGDAGGAFASASVTSFTEALAWAEQKASASIAAQRAILEQLMSGALPWPEPGDIFLPGIGRVAKP